MANHFFCVICLTVSFFIGICNSENYVGLHDSHTFQGKMMTLEQIVISERKELLEWDFRVAAIEKNVAHVLEEMLDAKNRRKRTAADPRLVFFAGKKGSPGFSGKSGRPGTMGRRGQKGFKGAAGSDGLRGPPGPFGHSGWHGSPGRFGAIGIKGEKGDTGIMGIPGLIGDVGYVGVNGEHGRIGHQGEVGHIGFLGMIGVYGPPGEPGLKGPFGELGERGSCGLQGPVGLYGEPGPMGELGFMGSDGGMGRKGQKGERGMIGDIGPWGPVGASGPIYDPYALMFGAPMVTKVYVKSELNCSDIDGEAQNCSDHMLEAQPHTENSLDIPYTGKFPVYQYPPPGAHVMPVPYLFGQKQLIHEPQQFSKERFEHFAPAYSLPEITQTDSVYDHEDADILSEIEYEQFVNNSSKGMTKKTSVNVTAETENVTSAHEYTIKHSDQEIQFEQAKSVYESVTQSNIDVPNGRSDKKDMDIEKQSDISSFQDH